MLRSTEEICLINQLKWLKNIWQHWKDFNRSSDDYTTGCLLDFSYFKKCYKLIEIDLCKQQKLGADPKAMEQINFTGNLDTAEGTTMFFIIEEAKKTVLGFSKRTVKVLWFYFKIILI